MTVDVKVGDVFACSWGYDQTNVNYYEVVSVTPSGKSVKIIPIWGKVVEGANGPCERTVPDRGNKRDWDVLEWSNKHGDEIQPKTKRLQLSKWDSVPRPYITVGTGHSARLVLAEDETHYQTGAMYGR